MKSMLKFRDIILGKKKMILRILRRKKVTPNRARIHFLRLPQNKSKF